MRPEDAPSPADPVVMLASGREAEDQFVLGDAPFWPVDRLVEPDAWAGHIPFAFWIVAALRPRLLVELGTHSGNSYLAFCQAVRNLGLSTACFAVDTWQGDVHAGFYGEEVYRELVKYHDPRYGAFSRLVRSTFDAARAYLADGSVDLLHIDGLHTYDAIAADLETWRGKLSTRAVVLLHDTNVREREFAVWRLWEELAARHPHFTFLHSHGLGVLGVGADLPGAVLDLLHADQDAARVRRIRDVFAGLGGPLVERIRRQQLESDTEVLRQEIATRDQQLERFRSDTAVLQRSVERLEAETRRLGEELAARDEQIKREAGEVAAAEAETRRLGEELAARDEQIKREAGEVAAAVERLDLIQQLQQETVRLGQLVEAGTREVTTLQRQLKREERGRSEVLEQELRLAAGQAERLCAELELARGRITAMESSKFWKLRTRWFRLKRAMGVTEE